MANKTEENPVELYNLGKPMNWEEFLAMPEQLQVEYVRGLRKTYKCSDKQLAAMFGCMLVEIRDFLDMNDMNVRIRQKADRLEAWKRFLGVLPEDEDPEEDAAEGDAAEADDEIPEIPQKTGIVVKSLQLEYKGTLAKALTELEVYADVMEGQPVTVTVSFGL